MVSSPLLAFKFVVYSNFFIYDCVASPAWQCYFDSSWEWTFIDGGSSL